MAEAAAKTSDRAKIFALDGVYRRTSLHMSGSYIGGEHPGHRTIVVHVADSLDAAEGDTLQCWTELLAAPTDLREGVRIRVEGKLEHLVISGPRRYLPFLSSCKYTQL